MKGLVGVEMMPAIDEGDKFENRDDSEEILLSIPGRDAA